VALSCAVLCCVSISDASAGDVGGSQKRIYLANDDHTDYFWKGNAEEYRTAFLQMLDFYMDQAEDTATNPPDARGKFNCDGSMWVWEYERNKSAVEFERLIDHLHAGTITMPLNSLVLLYGAMPTEAVLRDMYYPGRLEREHGLRFPLVAAIENQTLPAGVASLWAGSGAKYSWKGVCGCATNTDWGDRPREIYHFQGKDGRSVCMKWNSMLAGNTSIGGYAEARYPSTVVPLMDSDPDFLARWPWSVSAAFGYGWDHLDSYTSNIINASLNLSNPNRRVIVSNEVDFFEDFLANYGDQIETYSGSFGNEWDLLTASLADVTAKFRNALEKLRTAEALATTASLYDSTFMDGRAEARDKAFMACGLYYEHDWTANGPVGRDAREQFQRDMLTDLSSYVDDLHDDALTALGGLVAHPGSTERHLVFNPLSWLRTDYADLPIETSGPVHAYDVWEDEVVPSQRVTIEGAEYLRILARNIPSIGYKVFEVRTGPGEFFPDAGSLSGMTVTTNELEITLGPGGEITSLVELASLQEWVDVALHDIGSGSGSAVLDHSGPVSTTVHVDAGGSPSHSSYLTVFHNEIHRVEMEGQVTENFGGKVEVEYSFDLPNFVARHEEVGQISTIARKSDGGDYSDDKARLDYLTFNHFVDFSNEERGVTISNRDASYFKMGNSTYTNLDTSTPSLRAVVGMQVDGQSLGILNQGGDSFFRNRFALHPHGQYDQTEAMRFSLEHQNPLVATRVTGGELAPLPSDRKSVVGVGNRDVIVWALKPAEEGMETGGAIARLWNVSDELTGAAFSMPGFPFIAAKETSHIETDENDLWVFSGITSVVFEPQELQTIRVFPTGPTADVDPVSVSEVVSELAVHPLPARAGVANHLSYSLANPGYVRLAVFDVSGRLVSTVFDGVQSAGSYDMTWPDVRDPEPIPGVYFARLEYGGETKTTKVIRTR